MARLLRVEFPGAIYHVTCRMVGEGPPAGGYGDGGWPRDKRLFRDDREHWLCPPGRTTTGVGLQALTYVDGPGVRLERRLTLACSAG